MPDDLERRIELSSTTQAPAPAAEDLAARYAAVAEEALRSEYDRRDDEAILLHGLLAAALAIYHRLPRAPA